MIKEITIKTEDKFNSDKYPESGFYKTNQEANLQELMYVNKVTKVCQWVDSWQNASLIFTIEKEEPKEDTTIELIKQDDTNKITEEFALKMISIALNKEKYKDLK